MIAFSAGGEFVRIETAPVTVEISKCPLAPPTVSAKEYSGYRLTADIAKSHLYTTVNEGGEAVGSYPVILTLTDSENYCWAGRAALRLSFGLR